MRFLLLLFLFPASLTAQTLKDYNQDRLNLDKKLMIGLGSWSIANIGVSGVGWATTDLEAKHFHQMNVMWGGVNLALALPGYFKARKTDANNIPFSETWKQQGRTEKVFLFNTALDIFYVTGGFYLKQRALIDADNYHRYRGWGNSLIMQGGFLFAFDLLAVLLHSKHRKTELNHFWDDSTSLSFGMTNNGMGVRFCL